MEQIMNGVLKPADVIAKGPHVFVEGENKYKESSRTFQEFPRAMYHETEGYREAVSKEQQEVLEAQGWQTKPFPPKPAKETVTTPSGDLALIVLQQAQTLQNLQDELTSLKLSASQPVPAETSQPKLRNRGGAQTA